MKIRILDQLAFISVSLRHQQNMITLHRVLLDTGSSGSVFSRQALAKINLVLAFTDTPIYIYGVGGSEIVFRRYVDEIILDDTIFKNVMIEIGDMDYGIALDGIIGLDLLLKTNAIIDFNKLELQLN